MSVGNGQGVQMIIAGTSYVYWDEYTGVPKFGLYVENAENPTDRAFILDDEISDAMDELGLPSRSSEIGFIIPRMPIRTLN